MDQRKLSVDNCQAPQRSTSQLKQRTQSLQPRTRPSWKRALVNAGVDQSSPLKRQRMAIKVQDQQWDPDSREKIDHLCCLFSKLCHFWSLKCILCIVIPRESKN